MSELENIKPVAFYRADWKGDMMFRKDNTVVIRKNEGDFTTGWIKPLYDELPEPQPQLTIPKSIADTLDIAIKGLSEFEDYLWAVDEFDILVPYDRAEYFRKWSNEEMNAHALAVSYVTGKALGVDLVKVVEG